MARREEEILQRAANALSKQIGQLPNLLQRGRIKIERTNTGGYRTVLGTIPDAGIEVELWFDRATGGRDYRFWYGFAGSDKSIRRMLAELGEKPTLVVRDADLTKQGAIYIYKNATEEQGRPFAEYYRSDDCFYGQYDWGGHGTKSVQKLWQGAAADFFKSRLRWAETEDDAGIEGAQSWGYRLHRKRDTALRQKKLNSVLLRQKRLICEVPRCGFDFKHRHGELGSGFAEVHHTLPLAAMNGATPTKLIDLVVLCSNCHRMIHRAMRNGAAAWPPPKDFIAAS